MSENLPNGCLDGAGQMYRSADDQNLEKARKDRERWSGLMCGVDNSSATQKKEKEQKR